MRPSSRRSGRSPWILSKCVTKTRLGVRPFRAIENCQDKMGLNGWKWSSLNAPGTHTPLSHSILELDSSLFSLLAHWANKNWPPSMKVQQIENCQNKIGLIGWKCECPGHSHPLSHTVLELDNSHLSLLGRWDNKNWPPNMKVQQIENYLKKIGLVGCKWYSFNVPGGSSSSAWNLRVS